MASASWHRHFSLWPSPLLLPSCKDTSQTNSPVSWLLCPSMLSTSTWKDLSILLAEILERQTLIPPSPPLFSQRGHAKAIGQIYVGCPVSGQAPPYPHPHPDSNQPYWMVGWRNEVARGIPWSSLSSCVCKWWAVSLSGKSQGRQSSVTSKLTQYMRFAGPQREHPLDRVCAEAVDWRMGETATSRAPAPSDSSS